MVELTTLEGKDTSQKVHALCRKAIQPAPEFPDLPHCAAVCVYPNMVSVAKQALGEHSGVNIAAVATGFPAGLIPMDMKIAEVKKAVALGANEIDMVINRGAFLAGEHSQVYNEILAVKEACGDRILLRRAGLDRRRLLLGLRP